MDNLGIKHNKAEAPKTGQWRYMKPEVDSGKCTGCGTCVKFCPEATMSLKSQIPSSNNQTNSNNQIQNSKLVERKTVEIDYDWCKGCGVCANVCPAKAIRMVSGS